MLRLGRPNSWATRLTAPLIQLTWKDVPFDFSNKQIAVQSDLKQALIDSPAIHTIDDSSNAPVILSVDTSFIAIGFFLTQCDLDNPWKCYYSRFGSITLNERELRFSQPKLELYGLYRALGALWFYLIGIRNLIVKVDARYIKGMLSNPDVTPSASINRWIVSILTFHFTLVHVTGTHHGPDGLSQWPVQDSDDSSENNDKFGDWIDNLHGFLHQINQLYRWPLPLPTSISTFVLTPEDLSYDDVPHSDNAKKDNDRLTRVRHFLETMVWPTDLSDADYATFVWYCTEFFLD